MVFSGLVTAWRLATWPTSRLPSLAKATTEGVVRAPSELVITTGSPPSMTATTELVVPKSIPIILLIRETPPELKFAHILISERKAVKFFIKRAIRYGFSLYSGLIEVACCVESRGTRHNCGLRYGVGDSATL